MTLLRNAGFYCIKYLGFPANITDLSKKPDLGVNTPDKQSTKTINNKFTHIIKRSL